VSAVGSNWVEFERSLPYDVRLKWRPVVHAFKPTVQNSGFENFAVEFPWSERCRSVPASLLTGPVCPGSQRNRPTGARSQPPSAAPVLPPRPPPPTRLLL
jgi:hypothetical protein